MPKLPDAKRRAWFKECKPHFPIGAQVRGNEALADRLAKAPDNRRVRDMNLLGTVQSYDDMQCRLLVVWDHPAYKDLKDPPAEPLSPEYVSVVTEG